MNEHTLNDPQLQSLEARLSAAAPQLSPTAQRQVLYQCAFAAGQRTSRASLRRWRAASAALLVLLVGLTVSLPHRSGRLARRKTEPPVPVEINTTDHGPGRVETAELRAIPLQQPPTVELDAWQIQPPDRALADGLAQLDCGDPHLRSLTVGMLTRAALEP